MKPPNANDIKRLTKKLQKQNDISLQEADWIYSLFSPDFRESHPNAYHYNSALVRALEEWYDMVSVKIESGCRGNFLFSVVWDSNKPDTIGHAISKVNKALSNHGSLEDFFAILMTSSELYHSFPKWFQRLFTKAVGNILNNGEPQYIYTLTSPRVGMYHYPIETETGTRTIAQLMKRFTPAIKMNTADRKPNPWILFDMATGRGRFAPWHMKEYVFGTYLRNKKVPLIFMENYMMYGRYTLTFFTEKDKARLVKTTLEIPFEELVNKALREKVIEASDAKMLLNNNMIREHLFEKFVETSTKWIDMIVRAETNHETARKMIEEEDGWLEMGER